MEHPQCRVGIVERRPVVVHQLIPARPDDKRRVVPAAGDHLLGLVLDVAEELGVVGGPVVDAGGGLNELLPDHDTQPVAGVVEGRLLKQPSAPDAQQVRVRVGGHADPPIILPLRRAAVELLNRAPVPALDEYALAVDLEAVGEGPFGRVVVLDRSYAPDAEGDRALVDHGAGFVEQGHLGLVEGLAAMAVRPPQLRAIDAEASGCPGALPGGEDRRLRCGDRFPFVGDARADGKALSRGRSDVGGDADGG